jgi:hypothetical protein
VPYSVRHRIGTVLITLVALAAVGGGVAWLVTRTHHGTGPPGPPVKVSQGHALDPIALCQTCAQGFNPLGTPTDESPYDPLAIDDQQGTFWRTQQYYDHKLEKAGTGIWVNASPGTAARALRIIDATPGFVVTIYGRNGTPPITWPDSGWVKLSNPTTVARNTVIHLTAGAARYDYYLVWITDLGQHEQLAIDQITLYR